MLGGRLDRRVKGEVVALEIIVRKGDVVRMKFMREVVVVRASKLSL